MNEEDIKKLAAAQQQQGGGEADAAAQAKQQQQQVEEAQARKNQILSQILEADAYSRLQRISLVRPDRCAQVEASLIKMATNRQLSGKVSEKQLIGMLEQYSEQTKPKTKITIQRKNNLWDEDDDFNDDTDSD
ncbi:hypothetical protein AKO1_011883 [Acrasis kona]|uniref:Programmed cell death protein 5 n=1 Tax=Acrasis kona TaxID=1008807 RepID=A0AAW2Z3M3_9EUKA